MPNWDAARVGSFTTAPVLAHYDSTRETWVETDALDFVVAGVLSQMHDGVLRAVAYFSKKMSPAKCNYMIYDKELLAIIKSFETWRPELANALVVVIAGPGTLNALRNCVYTPTIHSPNSIAIRIGWRKTAWTAFEGM